MYIKVYYIFACCNLHYEKFADGTLVCIEEEIPFDLPIGWSWGRLQSFCFPISDGTHQTPTYTDEGYIFLSAKNVTSWKIDWDNVMHIPESLHNELSKRISPKRNDILLAKNGTIGVAAIVDRDCDFDIYVTLAVLRIIHTSILPQYLLNAIASSTVQNEFRASLKGIGVQNLHLEHIRRTLIPIPPFKEQNLISDKIVEITPLLEHITETYAELDAGISVLKAKILDLAIRGKLVPQNPDDEPASALLERIRAEKEVLIKQGKIKRGKKESVIFKGDDNSYYENLPSSWAWATLGMISQLVTKGTTPRGGNVAYAESGIGFLRAENIKGFDQLSLENLKYVDEETHNNFLKRSILQSGDVLITIAGTLGRTAIVSTNDLPLNTNQAIAIVRPVSIDLINIKYVVYALNAEYISKTLLHQEVAMAIPNLSLENISDCAIPLPPLEEQNRIVEFVEKAFQSIDGIEL